MSILEPHYAGIPPDQLPTIERNPIHVVLDNFRSAFNVGSAFRTSDAGAIEHLYLCGLCAHPPNPKLEKTALGAFDYVAWTYHPTTTEVLETLRPRLPVVAVENTSDAVVYTEFDWPTPVALVLGHEVEGIDPQVLQLCHHKVSIPVLGYKRTINVATAYGVILFEILRQWGRLAPPVPENDGR